MLVHYVAKAVEGYSHSWVVILLFTGGGEKSFRGTSKAGVGKPNGKLDWKSGAEWLEESVASFSDARALIWGDSDERSCPV